MCLHVLAQNNMICHRIFLHSAIIEVLVRKSPIYYLLILNIKKSLNYFLFIGFYHLWQIKFFCPTRNSMGILEMDFERKLGAPFFLNSSHSITLCKLKVAGKKQKTFSNFSCMFLNLNNFFQFEF